VLSRLSALGRTPSSARVSGQVAVTECVQLVSDELVGVLGVKAAAVAGVSSGVSELRQLQWCQ